MNVFLFERNKERRWFHDGHEIDVFLFQAAIIFAKNVNSLNKFETSHKKVYSNDAENPGYAVKNRGVKINDVVNWGAMENTSLLFSVAFICFVAADALIRKSIIKLITLLVCSAA